MNPFANLSVGVQRLVPPLSAVRLDFSAVCSQKRLLPVLRDTPL